MIVAIAYALSLLHQHPQGDATSPILRVALFLEQILGFRFILGNRSPFVQEQARSNTPCDIIVVTGRFTGGKVDSVHVRRAFQDMEPDAFEVATFCTQCDPRDTRGRTTTAKR
jgi:hypothetical protein